MKRFIDFFDSLCLVCYFMIAVLFVYFCFLGTILCCSKSSNQIDGPFASFPWYPFSLGALSLSFRSSSEKIFQTLVCSPFMIWIRRLGLISDNPPQFLAGIMIWSEVLKYGFPHFFLELI